MLSFPRTKSRTCLQPLASPNALAPVQPKNASLSARRAERLALLGILTVNLPGARSGTPGRRARARMVGQSAEWIDVAGKFNSIFSFCSGSDSPDPVDARLRARCEPHIGRRLIARWRGALATLSDGVDGPMYALLGLVLLRFGASPAQDTCSRSPRGISSCREGARPHRFRITVADCAERAAPPEEETRHPDGRDRRRTRDRRSPSPAPHDGSPGGLIRTTRRLERACCGCRRWRSRPEELERVAQAVSPAGIVVTHAADESRRASSHDCVEPCRLGPAACHGGPVTAPCRCRSRGWRASARPARMR